jgi:hypothetical protein
LTAPSAEPTPNASFIQRVWENVQVVLGHAIGTAVNTLAIWGNLHLLIFTLGKNHKLFDQLPIIYICDFGDLLIMLLFCWKVLEEF